VVAGFYLSWLFSNLRLLCLFYARTTRCVDRVCWLEAVGLSHSNRGVPNAMCNKLSNRGVTVVIFVFQRIISGADDIRGGLPCADCYGAVSVRLPDCLAFRLPPEVLFVS
jgi:hypothetical protein